jgi:DNA replication initiation complex subunit (GINS family)
MEIRITLETLYDILRNEKKKAELQKLDKTFFTDVVAYMMQKQALLDNAQSSDNLFASGEKEKLEYELRSIRRIIKGIYEKREKKIIDIALNKSRTQFDLVDLSLMLPEEREFYRSLLSTFDLYRRGILVNLMKGSLPTLSIIDEQKSEQQDSPTDHQEQQEQASHHTEGEPSASDKATAGDSSTNSSPAEQEEMPAEPRKKKIKFIHPVPDFIWTDMKEYGPFEPGDQTEIWPEVADLLIKKGHAVEVT